MKSPSRGTLGWHLIAAGRGKIRFIQGCDLWQASHSPGQSPHLRLFGQCKLDSLGKDKERTQSNWAGKWEGMSVAKIH